MLCETGCMLGYLLELENKVMMMMMIGGTWNVCIRGFYCCGRAPEFRPHVSVQYVYCENQGVY